MSEMTKRERDVYDFIVAFRKERGFSPTVREVATGIGLLSCGSVQKHIKSIIVKGWLQPCNGKNRALVPVGESA